MHQFDRDIRSVEQEPFTFLGRITDNWSVNGIPNGGYLLAVMAEAMMQHGERKSTPVITANFLNRCEPGDVKVSIEKMSASRQFDRFQAGLFQNAREKIRAFGTFANDYNECALERYEAGAPHIADLEKCVPIPEIPDYTIFSRMDVRLDPLSAGWMTGNLSEASENKGWIKFRADRPFDIPSLLLIADSFPPAVLSSQGMVAWVPTIEMSVNIRKIPTTAWLKCVFRTRFITCGLLEEDGEIWDQTGSLIAISRQIAQYRPSNKQP